MCGIVLAQPQTITVYFEDYCNVYIYNIYSFDLGWFSILLERALNCLLLFAVGAVAGLHCWLIPIQYLIIFYRGFILGIICGIMISVFGVIGGIVLFTVFLPQYLLITALIIGFSAYIYENGLINKRAKRVCYFVPFLKVCFAFIALALVAALIENVFIVVIIRPLSVLL